MVNIDENDNIVISDDFTHCQDCGLRLYGAEAYGEDANGYCDSCNA